MFFNKKYIYILFLRYLTYKIQEGSTTDILCPAFECFKLVPLEIIEKIVSPDMSTRYQHFDIKVSKINTTR